MMMPMTTAQVAKGLEGVVAEATALSDVQGQVGRLLYRGYDINDLAEHSTFEETVFLLWYGALPTRAELEEFRTRLANARSIPDNVIEEMQKWAKDADAMDVLRTVVSLLGLCDEDRDDRSEATRANEALRLTAQMATITAAWNSIRNGREVVPPRPDLSHAANFLYMLQGREPTPEAARIMDTALILHADHGLNASTFVARSIASTLSDMYSAITGALGALKGPLHGGANEEVMRMLIKLDDVSTVGPFVDAELQAKRKIPGFGHRVYKADDPRALWLRRIAADTAEHTGNRKWYEMQEKMRELVTSRKHLPVNVDFYSASVYYTLEIPIDLFTPVFAISRIAGWTAHVLEQYKDNRIIRPDALYVGERDLKYIPIDER